MTFIFKKGHVTMTSIDSATKPEEADKKIVYMEELEKRKEAYGICGNVWNLAREKTL